MSNDKYDIKPMPEKVCDYRESMWRTQQMLVQDIRKVKEKVDKHEKDIFRIKIIGPIGMGVLLVLAYIKKILGI